MSANATRARVLLAPDLLRACAEQQPDLAPINVDGRDAITYQAWDLRSNAIAHVLLDRGVNKGDRVVLYYGGMDWVDYTVAYFGVLKAGATATHLNDLLGPDELRRRLDHAEAIGMIHGVAMTPPADFAGWTVTVPELGGTDESPVDVQLRPSDVADIVYTGGTTGPAKPLANPHGNLVFGRGLKATAKASFDGNAPLLLPMPLGSSYSAGTVGIFALTTTASIVVCPTDDVERMAELVEEYKIGSAMLPPWVAMQMVERKVGDRHDLSSITTVGVASAPMPPRYASALLAMMPNAKMVSAYGGGSEAVPANMTSLYDPDRPALMGRPVAGTDLRLADPDGREVAQGEVGEILLRTSAPRRYYLDKELDKTIRTVDGFVRTGDLGYVNADGELFFFDRGKDALRIGGQLVSSIEVENALYEHPAVRGAAVVAVPGGDLGQRIVAAVVLEPSEQAPSVAELHTFATERLSPERVPDEIHLLDELPRAPLSGKVLKRLLRERFAADPPVPAPAVATTELNSATAGFLIHRSGLIRYEFRAEALQFAAELVDIINATQQGVVSVSLYEEVLGVHSRLHWMLYLRQPNDYGRLLNLVDHDRKWREIADLNRLPTKGGGGWERMFVEGSIREAVICPQHGLGHADHDAVDTFQPAARFQTTLPYGQLLHSANSALTVHRAGQAAYAVREEARLFSYEWASYVNTALAGTATAFIYEEMWGTQDRIHTLIHLNDLGAYPALLDLAENDPGMRDLLAREWVPVFKGGGGWEKLFIDGTLTDTLWRPRRADNA